MAQIMPKIHGALMIMNFFKRSPVKSTVNEVNVCGCESLSARSGQERVGLVAQIGRERGEVSPVGGLAGSAAKSKFLIGMCAKIARGD